MALYGRVRSHELASCSYNPPSCGWNARLLSGYAICPMRAVSPCLPGGGRRTAKMGAKGVVRVPVVASGGSSIGISTSYRDGAPGDVFRILRIASGGRLSGMCVVHVPVTTCCSLNAVIFL